jgi:hypothetical protein
MKDAGFDPQTSPYRGEADMPSGPCTPDGSLIETIEMSPIMGKSPALWPAVMLIAATLPSCTTPQQGRIAEADRLWRCALSHPLPHGSIAAFFSMTRAGMQRDTLRFHWRRIVSTNNSIELGWSGTEGVEPDAAAQATLSFWIGPRYEGHRRLELRRAGPDGAAGELVFSSRFEPMPWRVSAHWGDVLAAARDGAFIALVTDRRGGIHAQTRVEGNVVAEPARAAATLQPEMSAMVADYERRCQPGSDREDRVILL